MRRRWAGCLLFLLSATAVAADVRGLQPGTTVPDFRLPDQTGAVHDLQSVSGTNGAVLVFYRSADW